MSTIIQADEVNILADVEARIQQQSERSDDEEDGNRLYIYVPHDSATSC